MRLVVDVTQRWVIDGGAQTAHPTTMKILKPTESALVPDLNLKAMVRAMESDSNMSVTKDWTAGTVEVVGHALAGDVILFRAIQKGHGQPWIVTMFKGLLSLV